MHENDNSAPASSVQVVGQLVGYQALVVTVAAAFVALTYGRAAAVSLAAGGGIHVLGGLVMALRSLRTRATTQPGRVMAGFFVGEVVKFALTILLFTTALVAFAVRPGFMLTGYLVATLGYWLILLKI